MRIEVMCVRCQKDFELEVTEQQLEAWRSGTLIQKAMPNLTPDQRELLISGYCGACFDVITGAYLDDDHLEGA